MVRNGNVGPRYLHTFLVTSSCELRKTLGGSRTKRQASMLAH